MFAGKKSAQIREILISESAWEEMTCLFAPSLNNIQDSLQKGMCLSSSLCRTPSKLKVAFHAPLVQCLIPIPGTCLLQ
ncbi:hypothetical protein C7O24_21625 [Salmonella enterica]|nr:hypothetical protein [Salmonella enterica]